MSAPESFADLSTGAAASQAVIVPLDGSSEAIAAVPVARELAGLLHATVHFAHVTRGHPMPLPELASGLRLRPSELSGGVLDELPGEAGSGIVALAGASGRPMVVMTASRDGLGPVAREVLDAAPGPVVLVDRERPALPYSLRRVLVASDGRRRTARAVRPAIELAERAGASLWVLHVAPAPGEGVPGPSRLPQYVDQPQHEWPEWAREFLERFEIVAGMVARVPSRVFLLRGEPPEEIARFAASRAVDLVAVGWPGEPEGLREIVTGAGCPVLVNRG